MNLDFKKQRLLIIAPHADDEILGCYGLIRKIKENHGKVFLLILTMGDYARLEGKVIKKEVWKKELDKVTKILKIDSVDIGFYDDKIRHLDTIELSELLELIELKSKVGLSKIKPTMVAIPTIFSTHQDHIHAYKAAMSALREHPQKIKTLPQVVLSYESPEYYFWSPYSEFGKFAPNFYIKLNKKEIQNKIKLLYIYKSQIRKNHRDDKKITGLANIRGNEIGTEYAESYHIHRLYI